MIGNRSITLLGLGVLASALVGLLARPAMHDGHTVLGALEPVTILAGSKWGGTISEVCARPLEHVQQGQLLARFDTTDLDARRRRLVEAERAAERAAQSGQILGAIPKPVQMYLYESHPDLVRAEAEYVAALSVFEKSADAGKAAARLDLDRAATNRARVRRELGQALSRAAAGDLPSIASEIRARIAEIDQLEREAEVRAPADAVVDILDVKIGDRMPPGPLAVLTLPGEYFSDIAVTPKDAARLRLNASSHGLLDSRSFDWRVESVSKRVIPIPFRENRLEAEQTILRARVCLPASVQPGGAAIFQLP